MFPEQLDLFSWDRIRFGRSCNRLAQLDFQGAKKIAQEILAVFPEHQAASKILHAIVFWEKIIGHFRQLQGGKAVLFLWKAIRGYNFSEQTELKKLEICLLKEILRELQKKPAFYSPPDLCTGYIHLLLGENLKAETSLRVLLESLPKAARLWGHLGSALWNQGRIDEAKTAYVRGLLFDPDDVAVEEIRDRDLQELIGLEGVAMAPIHGWLQGILPMTDIAAEEHTGSGPFVTYQLLLRAEGARKRVAHEEMVNQRRLLKEVAPHIFAAYMEKLANIEHEG